MTREQILREARKLQVEAALLCTKLDFPARRAAMLVLVGFDDTGNQHRRWLEKPLTLAEAARKVGKQKQNIYRALKRVKAKLAEVEAHR